MLAALMLWLPAEAQLHRGGRTIVRGGMFVKPDSLRHKSDSLANNALTRELDSLLTLDFTADSLAVTALRTDDLRTTDSLMRLRLAGIKTDPDSMRHKKGCLMSDSMSLSKVCWISTVLPGYGQIYNKQYWKLPILYGTVGAGLALYINENRTYKPLKREYDAYTDKNLTRTPELDALQAKMIRSNTRRQVYLGLTVASYIYFIGDAAVNYSTNDVSNVKKATTLACIFPGAGQIYNKSYWKVPFVVGGFAAMIYCIDWNNRGYQRFKKAYRLLNEYEQNPDKFPDGPTDEFHGRYSADYIRNLRNNFRRNRDLCIIISAGLYVLQIVDAHVDAHLKDYDISDDLTMNLEPKVAYTYVPSLGGTRPVFGFAMSINFFPMCSLLTFLLLLAVAVPASALDRRPRKKDKKKNKTEAVVTPPAAPVAEQQAAPEPEEPELPDPAEVQYDDMTLGLTAEQADSLVAVWRERQCGDSYQEFFDNYILVDSTAESTTTDSVYIQRLRALVSPIQLPYNSIVRGYINRYTDSRYGTISRILGMSQYYFPLIEDELRKEELPVELRALPIIESALSTTAVSPMGAVGLWQFMPSTGKSYGLEVNSLVDERRDPVRSTQAACRYLKDLYAIYNDWSLAIAAYNCGPGNVNKAIARSGGNGRTFWDIFDFLPRETRGDVPAFIGASYAYAYHRQHGIELTESPIPLATDTIRIDRLMHLGQIASTIDIPIETLRQLTPQYKLDIIPATTKPYTLVLPQRNITQYIANEPAIFAKDSAYLKEYINPANIDKKRQERSGTVYVVKKGDTLGAIARRYRVTTAQLMRWNGIKNAHKLRLGQRIRIEGR